MLKFRADTLEKLIDDEIASIEDILRHSSDYYANRGKADYNISVEASYLQGRIDALVSMKRHILPKPMINN